MEALHRGSAPSSKYSADSPTNPSTTKDHHEAQNGSNKVLVDVAHETQCDSDPDAEANEEADKASYLDQCAESDAVHGGGNHHNGNDQIKPAHVRRVDEERQNSTA